MNSKIIFGLSGLLIGAAVTALLINGFNVTNPTVQNYSAARSSDAIDAHFIEQMIPHHDDAITMAKLAQAKAQRPEIKKLADDIIKAQSQEITQMKDWYKNWFGKDVPTDSAIISGHGMMGNNGMHMGTMGNETDITDLEQAADFDIAFVEQMIPHHQMAVMMANMLKNSTTRPEMKQLAENIITSQSQEIAQMRSWLKEWR